MKSTNTPRRTLLSKARPRRSLHVRAGSFATVAIALLSTVLVAAPSASAQTFLCAGEVATLIGTSGPDVLNGTPGDDVIVGLGGADVINGRGGADLICAGFGADTVRGGVGPDTVFAGPGHDRVTGGDGHDTLFGGEGADILQGNKGADRVVGGPGRDQVMGGFGLDIVEGGLGADRVNGGPGADRVDGGAGTDRCSADDTNGRCELATAETADGIVEPGPLPNDEPPQVERVIHVSIDGLRSDHVTDALMPVTTQLRREGVSTLNARSDPLSTKTLPNHLSQFTGRPVHGASGHGVDFNEDDGATVHRTAGEYVASVFDVVHDHGLETAVFAGKSKFELIRRSWNDTNGALDTTGADDGRSKFDVFVRENPDDAVSLALAELDASPDLAFMFFHIRHPDTAGHDTVWGSATYVDAVTRSDRILGELVDAIAANPEWRDSTAIIVTSDHGGPLGGNLHADPELQSNYTIPFVVWAPGVTAGGDLYDLNPQARRNPGGLQVSADGRQPIRGHEAGNLALDLLGLPAIPGSVFNADFDLALR